MVGILVVSLSILGIVSNFSDSSAAAKKISNYSSSRIISVQQTEENAVGYVFTGSRIWPSELYPSKNNPGSVNPDITQSNISQNLCNPHWSTKTIRPPVSYTNTLKWKQIREYWYSDTSKKSYEEDHIIPLEVGGNPSDPKNLFPEPYNTVVNGKIVGAHQKDVVENKLHSEVCSGRMKLKAAQQIFMGDWYAYYLTIKNPKKYEYSN